MYKIDRRGGARGGVKKTFSRNIPKVKLRHFLGQVLRLGQARGPSAAATYLTFKIHVQN